MSWLLSKMNSVTAPVLSTRQWRAKIRLQMCPTYMSKYCNTDKYFSAVHSLNTKLLFGTILCYTIWFFLYFSLPVSWSRKPLTKIRILFLQSLLKYVAQMNCSHKLGLEVLQLRYIYTFFILKCSLSELNSLFIFARFKSNVLLPSSVSSCHPQRWWSGECTYKICGWHRGGSGCKHFRGWDQNSKLSQYVGEMAKTSKTEFSNNMYKALHEEMKDQIHKYKMRNQRRSGRSEKKGCESYSQTQSKYE